MNVRISAARFAAAVLLATPAAAETVEYRQPPDPIARILDAPRTPLVTLSPDDRWLAEILRPGLPPIAEVAEPYVSFAGSRINPATHGPAREQGYVGLAIR